MAKVKIQGHASGTGVLTVTAPNTSTDRTITLPDTTGTLLDENSSLPAANLTGTVADARISTLTASKLTGALPAIDGSNLTGLSSGLSSASTFRLQADHSSNADLTNWAEATSTGDGRLGTAVSESGGVFSFPSTGIWLVISQITFHAVGNDQTTCELKVTTDNSSYSARSYCTRNDTGGADNSTHPMMTLVDVTNTSNVKVKFTASSLNSGSYLWGSASRSMTAATFIKLGET